MAVRVRLTRVGSKKNPIWRVVVADQRSPRDGRVIEQIGHYNPRTEPSTIVIDRERLDHWIELGAQPTNTVKKLMRAKPTEPGTEAPSAESPEAEPAAAKEEPAAEAEADSDAEPATTDEEPAAEADASGGGEEATADEAG